MYLKEGKVIKGNRGRYTVLYKLTVGGQSIIWLGSDKHGHKVIIKEPKFSGETESDRMTLERIKVGAKILKFLNNDYIEKYIDELDLNYTFYLITDYVNGQTIDKLFKNKPLDEKKAVEIILKILDAVNHLHTNNVLHRDIKPKNIIFSTKPVLIDFTTAKYFYTYAQPDKTIIYSPGGYTAPEQYQGLSLPQSDIWSIGAVLYFLLTGRDPITFLSGYPLKTVVKDPRKVISVSDNVADTIMRTMRQDYASRPSTAQEVIEILKGKTIRDISPYLVIGNRKYYLTGSKEFTIGRAKSNDIIIRDFLDPAHYISRHHVKIFERNGKWYIQDLGSTNKTAIYRPNKLFWEIIWSGKRKPSRSFELKDGDIIALAFSNNRGPYLTIQFRLGES